MQQKWVENTFEGDASKLIREVAKEQQVSFVTAKVLLNRGLDTKEKRDVYMHPSVYGLRDSKQMLNSPEAAELLKHCISEGKKIRIIGDYDVDGITSTYILYSALSERGALVSYRIPDRIKDGYGINSAMVDEAAQDGVEVILTCDNGISEYDTIAHAKDLGMTVIVTDHHEIPKHVLADGSSEFVLPPADIVVNPHQPGETYGFANVCGCVVALKLLCNMGVDFYRYLPYAAMATLCDVMDLCDENRVIVSLGLAEIRKTEDIGLSALIEANKLERMKISAYHIGFVIGPCLNASGRLETAEIALKLLLEQDGLEAIRLADELVELNRIRKEMTEDGTQRACDILEKVAAGRAAINNDSDIYKYLDKVIVVYLHECHESIAGIIAGRIREKYARPTFILTNSDGCVKGSGRSTENYSMYAEMQKVQDVFLRFGGHPMAAGLSIEKDKISEMQKRLNDNCTLSAEDLVNIVHIDARISFRHMTAQVVSELERLEPFGKGNEKALFADNRLLVEKAMVLGKNKNLLKLYLMDEEGFKFVALYFGNIPALFEEITSHYTEKGLNDMLSGRGSRVMISATYYPSINEFNGITSIEAKLSDIIVE